MLRVVWRSSVTQPGGRERWASSLALLQQRQGKLLEASLCAVTAARQIPGPVYALVAGAAGQSVAVEAAKVKGIDRVIFVQNPAYEKGLAETFAPLLAANIKQAGVSHVFASHSSFGKNAMPRTAALMDTQQISDVTSITNEDTFVRPIYAGNAVLTVQSADAVKFVTVRTTAFAPAKMEGGTAEIVEGLDPKAETLTEWVSEEMTASDRPELGTATRVVAGGRGLKSKEQFQQLIPPLADALGAAIGASRAAVDSGFADNSLQVGQTGKNVAPELYVCAGISGAIQHLAGMKESKVIAAIDKDPDAPIFKVADVGLVGDLFEKLPELTRKLGNQ